MDQPLLDVSQISNITLYCIKNFDLPADKLYHFADMILRNYQNRVMDFDDYEAYTLWHKQALDWYIGMTDHPQPDVNMFKFHIGINILIGGICFWHKFGEFDTVEQVA